MFIAAAGNSAADSDATPYYPSCYDLPNVISVAATDQSDALASFSNYGATTVDLAAPGVGVLSTYLDNSYTSMSGTSMATPHVSGVAALAWSLAPDATVTEMRNALLNSGDLVQGLVGKTVSGRRLNAFNTLDVFAGDAGDARATSRATRLALPVPGDQLIMPAESIADASDVDFYQIRGVAGSTLTALTSVPAGGVPMNTVLRLYKDGVQDAVASGSRIDYAFAADSVYYVEVAGNAGSTGDYQLELSLDVGDTFTTAAATDLVLGGSFVRPNAAIGDGLLGASDVDLYEIIGLPGSTLTATTGSPDGGVAVDTLLQLYQAEVLVASGNDQINYALADGEAYYLGVAAAVAGSTGDYRLELRLDISDTPGSAVRYSIWLPAPVSRSRSLISETGSEGRRMWTTSSSRRQSAVW